MALRPRVDPKNLFLDDDDIDDDTFLRNSRNQPTNNSLDNGYESRQMFEQRKREIEERTFMSTERSLGLLRETEVVGVATAEELVSIKIILDTCIKFIFPINYTKNFYIKITF